jgi:radical SAM protein with 4Fe4S-binding SPASM domain
MRQFSIELTTTNACSFRCSYCFENDFKEGINLLTQDYDKLVIRLKQLIYSDWMKEIADKVCITFWGGEPSLNSVFIYNIVNEFANDENVTFYIYTNGSRIKELLPSLLKVGPRFRVQVSYDGNPIHDLRRRTIDGLPTSHIVLDGLDILQSHGIKFTFKSTITYPDFIHIGKAWDDIRHLKNIYDYCNIHYALTVDYHNVSFEDHREDVERGLLDVAKREYNYFRENGDFLSSLFLDQKRICRSSHMMTIDTKGDLHPCHGSPYSSENLIFGNVFDNGFVETVQKHYDRFTYEPQINNTCANCVALNCLRCHVKKSELSKETNYIDRWNDFTDQPSLCDYYKLAGTIGRGLSKSLLGNLRE